MSRRLLSALAASALLGSAPAAAAVRSAATPSLPPGWSHAQINVTINGSPHTLIYDRGRIIAVSPTSVTLRERDGSVWTIDVSASTQITIDGQAASISQVRRLETATSMSIDGAPASKLTVQIPPALAAALAAAAARRQERQSQSATVLQTAAARRAARLAKRGGTA